MSSGTADTAGALLPRGGGERLLVVDDEPRITELLATTLRLAGYEVLTAATGRQALDVAARHRPVLAVLDVNLPDVDGFTLCGELRAVVADLPVVFLTARDSTFDKVTGLTAGGDDYVTKPFSITEIVARIQAILRRAAGGPPTRVLRCADLEIDDAAHEVRRAGRLVDLSPTEYRLLRHLTVNAGQVLSRRQLLEHVWQYDFGGDTSGVEKVVSNLRRKLETGGPPLIRTVRGFGYTLRRAP